MSHLIDSALLSSFDAGSFGLPIASENRPYDPQPGTAWAQLFVVHAQPSIATMGSGGQDEIFLLAQQVLAPEAELALLQVGARLEYTRHQSADLLLFIYQCFNFIAKYIVHF